MIRTPAAPRPLRVGAGLAGVAGIVLLAGCSTTGGGTTDVDGEQSSAPSSESSASGDTGDSSTASYADGTYTAEGSYATPESVETISVTVTLADDVITAVEVTGNPTRRESEQYQGEFIGGIADVVVGKDIDEISVSRVAGSSLTSGGFNEAIDQIKADAAA
ncbi:FMN-binding protein [Microbacterium terricola]|uniref:FMN-binding domain-containing protein n=1 Tax=Microbacterium terricola TaxID=344163 RepID=A0ABM8DZV5_9MICO|nr:FMN-binding protein [Microbacterium terricola]UYK41123.1 FMN-binding protein [Microbacterium terricola]BDV31115.1 hypothetical protein Microterr_17750 [Microbacterium terricola]